MKRHGEGKTMITFEEWWAYEGKRRRTRPYSAETTYSVKRATCAHNDKKRGQYNACENCLKADYRYDKVIIQRLPYA